jgi:hypothetical protein
MDEDSDSSFEFKCALNADDFVVKDVSLLLLSKLNLFRRRQRFATSRIFSTKRKKSF